MPDAARGECLNVGVVLMARTVDYLGIAVHLDRDRLRALAPAADPEPIAEGLRGLVRVAEGDGTAGPIARLERPQRFHWLVAPSSTVIRPSEVHTGLCDDPAAMVDHLMRRLVR